MADAPLKLPAALRSRRPSWYSLYATVFGLAVFGPMGVSWVSGLVAPAVAEGRLGPPVVRALYLAWALAAGGAVALALRAIGPVGMARPVLTFTLGAPDWSAAWHRRVFRARVILAVVLGVAAGVVAALLAWPFGEAALLGGTVGAAAVVGPALATLAAAEQLERPTTRSRVAAGVAVVLGLALAYLAGFGLLGLDQRTAVTAAAALAAATVAAALWRLPRVLAGLRDGAIPIGELGRGGDVVDRVSASAVTLTAIALHRAPPARRRLRIPTLRGPAAVALLDARRALARPKPLAVLAALVPLPGALAHALGPRFGIAVLPAVAYAATAQLAPWFFAWNASPGLKFLLPFGDAASQAALLATPLTAGLLFAVAAVAMAGLSPGWIPCALIASALGLGRRITARSPAEDLDSWVASPAGPIPIHLIRRLASGWDAALLAGLLGAFLPPTTVVLVLGALLAAWLGWRFGGPEPV